MKADGTLSEIEVQNSILEFLRFKKIIAWRNNNGSTYDKNVAGGFRRKNKWEKIHGDPVDILGLMPDGRFLAIEVKKNEKEKASPGQKTFLKNINESNGVGFVAYSIRCVKENLAL